MTVISPGYRGGRWHEFLDGVEVFRYPAAVVERGLVSHAVEYAVAFPSLAILATLAHLRRRVDVLHVANPPDLFFPLGRFFKRLGAAFVFDQHDPVPELHLAQGGRPRGLMHRFLAWCERQTLQSADVVIATNPSIGELSRQRGDLDPGRVVVVRSSIDTGRTFRVEPDPSLRAGREFLAVYVGVMGPQDGVDLLVQAVRHVEDLLPGAVRFLAIGDGPERGNAMRLADGLGVQDLIQFPGRLSDAEVRVALSTADVGVGPDPANGFNELCTMNKTLEYMGLGIPGVFFDLEETRRSAGDAAVYADPNDPQDFARRIVEVLSSAELRSAMTAAARQRMDGAMNWSNSVTELRRAYDKALILAQARVR